MSEGQLAIVRGLTDADVHSLGPYTRAAIRAVVAEIDRLKADNEELRFSVQSLLDHLADLAPHAARARGVIRGQAEGAKP